MFRAEQLLVESEIIACCKQHSYPEPREIQWNPIPFEGRWGISTSFFKLAAQVTGKEKERSGKTIPVPLLAQEIAIEIKDRLGTPPGFVHIEAINGYLNLYFAPGEFSARVIETVLTEGENFGCGEPNGERIMVEFSQPNTHKAFHVGHLRSAILGDAISRILECAGFEVIRANYPGDIGLHVIKWLWNYQKFHSGEIPGQDTTRWMGDLYTEANQRLEQNPELESEVRDLYARWDQREPEVVALWEKTRQWSLDGFDQIYDIFDIKFDKYYFNSGGEQPGKLVVEDLIERGIAEDERPDGSVIVRIDDILGVKKEKYRVLVVLRSDGTALYATQDLALAIQKFNDYKLDKSIYVVDVRQSLHFKQVFKTLEIAGFPWASRCIHLPYELVNLPGNVVMASREGTVVLLEDLVREATERALRIVETKNPNLSDDLKQKVALAVGLGALRYSMLARENTKTVTFEWESALNFEGQAAPYIQYAHVRASSILRRMEGRLPEPIKPAHELHETEIQLVDLISRIPGEIQRAATDYKPLHLTNLSYEVARAFSDFYNQCPVLKADPDVREFRLRLVAAARQAIANLLNTLGIPAPDVM
jgi:arginyl-tRNA synthetase